MACFGMAVGIGLFLWWLFDPNEQRGRAFEAELGTRPLLPDAEWVEQFFAEGVLNPEVPVAVRRIFAAHTPYPAEKLLPDDDLAFFWAELDAAELIRELESEFGITLSPAECVRTPCTIRAVAKLVATKAPRSSERFPN